MTKPRTSSLKRPSRRKGRLCAAFAAAVMGGTIFTGMTLCHASQSELSIASGNGSGLIDAFGQSAKKEWPSADPELGNWSAMLQHQKESLQDPAKAKAYNDYLAKFAPLKGYPLSLKAFFVNFTVTTDVAYTRDKDQYNIDDYWASPAETILSRKGDCEDYSILQKDVLRFLGVPESRMFITNVNAQGDTDFPSHSILLLNEAPDGEAPQFFILNDARPLIPADNAAVGQVWTQGPDHTPDRYVLFDARNEEGFWTTGGTYEVAGVPPPGKLSAKVAGQSGLKIG